MKKNKVLKIVLIVLGTLVALLAAAVLGVLLYLRSMAASLPETLPDAPADSTQFTLTDDDLDKLLSGEITLEELTGERRTMVFHEAPHRLRATLEDMAELLGDRPAALCRELTKLHEDTVRTTLSQAAEWYRTNEPRGEYVLVVAGREKQDASPMTLEEGVARVLALREGGMKLKDAVRRVSDDTGLPRNALYDAALKA